MCMYGSYYDGGKPSKEYKDMIKAAKIENKTERQRSEERRVGKECRL